MRLRKIFQLIILLLALNGYGQGTSPKTFTWFQYKGSGSIGSGKWGAMLDVQHRRIDFLETTSQHLIRPGITYQLGNQFYATIGTAFFWHNISTNSDEAVFRYEFRPFQFLQWHQSFPAFKLKHKFRFEQRYNRKTEQEQILSGYDFNYRAGYRIEVAYPLDENFSLNVYEELLINFGKEIIGEHLDQNRIYLGIRYKKGRFTYKTGYLWLAAPLAGQSGFKNSHILRVGVSHNW
ncbi:DUF2490 domain-containing protein [Ekhidna sp.]|uniref:DUF2490 domain-containing protein n=1 Tax=Ekhidna sp. TaxID=2608089 RepID=UPI00329782F3